MSGSCGLRDCGDPACVICAVGRLPQPERRDKRMMDGIKANAKPDPGKRKPRVRGAK